MFYYNQNGGNLMDFMKGLGIAGAACGIIAGGYEISKNTKKLKGYFGSSEENNGEFTERPEETPEETPEEEGE